MFQSPAFDRLSQTFADQFETEGGRVLYRRSLKGAPVEVSPEERDRLIAGFGRTLGWMHLGLIVATVVVLLALAAITIARGRDMGPVAIFAAVGVLVAMFMVGWWWAWNSPARLVAGRPTLGAPRTRDEMRRIGLKRIGWGQLGTVAAAGAVALWRIDWSRDLWRGWNALWLVLAAGAAVAVAVQAFRKWREESPGR